MPNIFIEGLQATGKTTLLTRLSAALPEIPVFREGDVSPVELAWCAYLTKADYEDARSRFPQYADAMDALAHWEGSHVILPYTRVHGDAAFYQAMEQHEIYNARIPLDEFRRIILVRYGAYTGASGLFECSFLQNTVETMLLYYCLPADEILAFYREAFAALKDRNFLLLYLDAADISRNLTIARQERVDENGREIWFSLMLDYLAASPYGQTHGFTGFDDLVSYMQHRQRVEHRILREIIGDRAIILPEKRYDFDALLRRISP